MHGRSRLTIDPRIPTMPGRSTSGFHRPDIAPSAGGGVLVCKMSLAADAIPLRATHQVMKIIGDPVSLSSLGAEGFARVCEGSSGLERMETYPYRYNRRDHCVGALNTDPRHSNPEAQHRGITTIVRWARCLMKDKPQANNRCHSDVAGLGSKIPGIPDTCVALSTKTQRGRIYAERYTWSHLDLFFKSIIRYSVILPQLQPHL